MNTRENKDIWADINSRAVTAFSEAILRASEEAKQGKNVTPYMSVEDFIKHLKSL